MRRSLSEGGPPVVKATAGKPAIPDMGYAYLLVSISHPAQHYIGIARDLKKRLADHNDGRSKHTAKFPPWKLAAYFDFADEKMAVAFEKYLKSGSGRAFLKRHFLPKL